MWFVLFHIIVPVIKLFPSASFPAPAGTSPVCISPVSVFSSSPFPIAVTFISYVVLGFKFINSTFLLVVLFIVSCTVPFAIASYLYVTPIAPFVVIATNAPVEPTASPVMLSIFTRLDNISVSFSAPTSEVKFPLSSVPMVIT